MKVLVVEVLVTSSKKRTTPILPFTFIVIGASWEIKKGQK